MKKAIYGLTAAALLLLTTGQTPVSAETQPASTKTAPPSAKTASALADTGNTAADPSEEKRVLVVFEDHVSEQEIDEKVKDAGGEITESYDQVPVASAEVTELELDELMEDPTVKHVEEDILVSLSYQSEDWGIQKTNTPKAWNSGFTGAGVKVAVIDSGIAAHSDLRIAGGVSTVDYTSSYNDDEGHGTHVAGVIAGLDNSIGIKGVAHETSLYAVKAFNSDGQAYLSDPVEGVDWAITHKMDIINLSAGTPADSKAFRSVIDKAYASGILVVAAAGNSGTEGGSNDTVNYPARYASAIGVAAVDQYNRRASFSSVGPAVEIAAPGVRVRSTYTGGRYAYSDGTSMAAPYVTGVLALMKQAYPDLSNKELRALLAEYTKDLGPVGRDSSFGHGLLQAASFEKVVVPPAVTGLKLNLSSIKGVPGEVTQLTALAAFDDGTEQDLTNKVTWTSANPAIATVSAGRVELKGYGSTVLKASYEGKSASVTVDVPEPNPMVGLQISSSSVTGKPGDMITLSASVLFKDGSRKEITADAVWSSSDTSIAIVADGTVTLNSYGSTTLQVAYGGRSAVIAVDVPRPVITAEPVMPEFSDVSSFYGPAVDYLVSREVTQGLSASEFGVYDSVRRVDAAVWIAKELELAVGEAPDAGFTDVPARGRDAVNALKEAGIIAGKTADTFGAYDQLTRGEIAIILQRAYRLSGGDASAFEDVSSRYETAVAALVTNGVTNGLTPTRYGVAADVTRGQLAIFLHRLSE